MKISVGDRVLVRLGVSKIPARVIELRGDIGYQGRSIVRVETLDKIADARTSFEVPVADLLITRRKRVGARTITAVRGKKLPAKSPIITGRSKTAA